MNRDKVESIRESLSEPNSNKTHQFKGLDYYLNIYHYLYRNEVKLLIYCNSERITPETMLERMFWDLAGIIDNTDIIEDFISEIEKVIPSKKEKYYRAKIDTHPPKTVFIIDKKPNKSYNFQFCATYFDKGKLKFDTLSINLREYLRNYRKEVYELLKVRNYYFHKFKVNFYFDLGYLEFLRSKLNGYVNEFISLRFCRDKLVIIFNRDINDNISCSGNVLEVLERFLIFGYEQLYTLLESFDIKTIDFKNSLLLESYVSYHLAKDIGCNVEIEQPELLKRLRLNQMNNNKKSLSRIGLKYHVHYLDFSHGYWEYETEFKNYAGVNRVELESDLLVLEPETRPKEQTTIDKYLISNEKAFMLIRGYLPITEFHIKPFEITYFRNDFTNIKKEIYEIKDLYGFRYRTKLIIYNES